MSTLVDPTRQWKRGGPGRDFGRVQVGTDETYPRSLLGTTLGRYTRKVGPRVEEW